MSDLIQALPVALKERIQASRQSWLVTGAAGFIGSNLVEALLALGHNRHLLVRRKQHPLSERNRYCTFLL
ncbi:MAG: NAD-dependent epimerase/dehydratase family protein, partial [Proteobacteria bacterium]|nr:NAD-dependent epimerase/dehydratase family protein [Pseudomonadota bacterium]